jgi:DNA-binding protein H-NS
MKDYRMIPMDELLSEREALQAEIATRAADELQAMENRRQKLIAFIDSHPLPAKKPRIQGVPKYRNPKDPAQTWTGRGKPPAWLEGLNKEDCRIPDK